MVQLAQKPREGVSQAQHLRWIACRAQINIDMHCCITQTGLGLNHDSRHFDALFCHGPHTIAPDGHGYSSCGVTEYAKSAMPCRRMSGAVQLDDWLGALSHCQSRSTISVAMQKEESSSTDFPTILNSMDHVVLIKPMQNCEQWFGRAI